MAMRKVLFAGAAAALALAGCADYPYDPYYGNAAYPNGPYYSDYYGSYYTGPTVGLGITYSDREGYWDGDRHWHRYGRRDRDHDHDHDR